MDDFLLNQAFENKIYKCFGYEFQNIFFAIMKSKYNDDFIMPKPQGRIGDKKNDGYIPSKGEYFAVYGPESFDLDKNYTILKLKTDLEGLINNIKNGEWKYELKKFVFVVNTRNNDTFYTEVVQTAEELAIKYSIEVVLWGSYEVRKEFNSLSIEEKKFVLQTYVSLDNFSLNIPILNTLIEKLCNSNYKKTKIDGIMEFKEKIRFNNLSDDRATDLVYSSYNINSLDLALNSLDSTGVIQEQLAQLLKDIYDEAKKICDNEDEVFDYLVSKLMDESSGNLKSINFKLVRETVIIIMSKYFENCTIFEKR